MIGFSLSDEQKQLQQLARDFTKNEIAPKSAHHDLTGEFPDEILKKAHRVVEFRVYFWKYSDQINCRTNKWLRLAVFKYLFSGIKIKAECFRVERLLH